MYPSDRYQEWPDRQQMDVTTIATESGTVTHHEGTPDRKAFHKDVIKFLEKALGYGHLS